MVFYEELISRCDVSYSYWYLRSCDNLFTNKLESHFETNAKEVKIRK